MFKWARLLLWTTLCCLMVVFSLSCHSEKWHKVLTFFFDGVPPIGAQAASTDEHSVEETPSKTMPVRKGTEIRRVLFEHPPVSDCKTCHGQSSRKNFSMQVKVVKPVPELCWDCHGEYKNLTGWVHGPVAVGQCLTCHNPHRSTVKHLLNEEVPVLCFRCHDQTAIEQLSGHKKKAASSCITCHQAHAGKNRQLLKSNMENKIIEP